MVAVAVADGVARTAATRQSWRAVAVPEQWRRQAAAVAGDAAILTRLAADSNNNVAEAALPTLRRLSGADSDRLFVDVLNRRTRTVAGKDVRPYEVIRTAAVTLESATPTPALVTALTGALIRITAERCETSRDTRLALIERIGQLGSPSAIEELTPLLKDFDPRVASASAELIAKWSGRPATADVSHPDSGASAIPSDQELSSPQLVSFEMDNGRRFEVTFEGEDAPLARTRFLTLVNRRHARPRHARHLHTRPRHRRRADLHQPRRQSPPRLRLHRVRPRLLRHGRRRSDRRGRPHRPCRGPTGRPELHELTIRRRLYQILTNSSAVAHAVRASRHVLLGMVGRGAARSSR